MSGEADAALSIRPLAGADMDALLSLYRHLIEHDVPLDNSTARDRYEHMLAHPGLTVLGAFVRNELVASCVLVVIPNLTRGGAPYGLIENVVTHGDHRRGGLGRAVIGAAVDIGFAAECYKVMLMTGSKRPETLDFYRACGFSQSKTGFEVRRLPPR